MENISLTGAVYEAWSLLCMLLYVRRMPSFHIILEQKSPYFFSRGVRNVLDFLHCRKEKNLKISQLVTRQENNFLPNSNDLPFFIENNASNMLGFSNKMEKSSFITDVTV